MLHIRTALVSPPGEVSREWHRSQLGSGNKRR